MRQFSFPRAMAIVLALTALVAGVFSHLARAEPAAKQSNMQECVILLHGLARTSKSMKPLAAALQEARYLVVNVDYPSRRFPIAQLANMAIPSALAECRARNATDIHFITHSMGGILLRQYLNTYTIPELKRVVMFAPPNKGSQVVDKLKNVPGFKAMNGPAGQQLGTDEKSVPNSLGPVNFDLGVIAGTRSINRILSLYLPNPDDGKVSLENTKIDGMHDFISVPVSHPFIMKNKTTIRQSLHYLRHGFFNHSAFNHSSFNHNQTD